jgi:hypothetical protein
MAGSKEKNNNLPQSEQIPDFLRTAYEAGKMGQITPELKIINTFNKICPFLEDRPQALIVPEQRKLFLGYLKQYAKGVQELLDEQGITDIKADCLEESPGGFIDLTEGRNPFDSLSYPLSESAELAAVLLGLNAGIILEPFEVPSDYNTSSAFLSGKRGEKRDFGPDYLKRAYDPDGKKEAANRAGLRIFDKAQKAEFSELSS